MILLVGLKVFKKAIFRFPNLNMFVKEYINGDVRSVEDQVKRIICKIEAKFHKNDENYLILMSQLNRIKKEMIV